MKPAENVSLNIIKTEDIFDIATNTTKRTHAIIKDFQ